jgi:hypothetical protein
MAGPTPVPALDVAPDPGCKTVCRREKVRPGSGREAGLGHAAVEPTRKYLRRVLQPGSGCRVSPSWLLENMGPKHTGKLLRLGCFFALMSAHVAEAAVWGLFLRWTRLLPSITDGIYCTAASITTLGYGDILLKYPWRHLGTLIAITGVLMFGCSTAFLFVILQGVWKHF